ncbi:probable flavin-containing monoamine oxidase A [Octopus vulgaris]|uniref:Amine oxidase n=1 Tax=Octopus vulgaris TaxID=6645 RepID=A0AA36ALJ9_OCTVU|nr:probable flavin-containing monoamine oxidase A [Octopus vulgaris]
MDELDCDVIVVGAGISGLTAAYELTTRSQLSIRVLEASERIGGRTRVVTLKGSNDVEGKWDVGGQFVGYCQPHIIEMLQKFNIGLDKIYVEGMKFIQITDGSIKSYATPIPNLSILSMLDLFIFLRKINKMCEEIDVYNPYSHPNAAVWDSMTLQEFTRANAWTKAAIHCSEAATRCMFGKETSQISLLHYLYYVKAGGGIDALLEATNGAAQEFSIKGGTGALINKLVENIKNDNNVLELKCAVTKIEQNNDQVIVYAEKKDSDNKEVVYKCKYCILAIPPHMLGFINFIPNLPSEKRELIKYMQPGNLTKVIFTYKEAFWRKKKFSGEIVTSVGPVCIVYDCSSLSPPIPALLAFVGGDQMVQWRQVEEPIFVKAVLDCLEKFLGPEVKDFISVASMDWAQEPYVLGSPTSMIVPGGTKYFPNMRKPYLRLLFAGTETATQCCGYMSGAIQAGQRAAKETLFLEDPSLLDPKSLEDTVFRDESFFKNKQRKKKFSWTNKVVGVGIGLTAGLAAWKLATKFRH